MAPPLKWKTVTSPPCLPSRRANDKGRGKPICLQSNFFEVKVRNPNIELIHYDVDIKEPNRGTDQLPKKKRIMIFEEMRKMYPAVFKGAILGFDSEKNAYSIMPLFKERKDHPEKTFEVDFHEEGGRKNKFLVTLKAVNHENLKTLMTALHAQNIDRTVPQTIIQMLEVLFQHNLAVRYERVGRNSFYSMSGEFGNQFNIGGGKGAMVGFFGSLRPVGWKENTLLLNVDVVHTACYKEQSVLDFMMELLGLQAHELNKPLSAHMKAKLSKNLKKIKIQVTHSQIPRTYKVLEVGDLGCDRQTFPLQTAGNGTTQCTVEKYFFSQYRKSLQYPKLNCLRVGSLAKNIYLPIECCRIAKGQKVQGKLSNQETAQFIRNTAKFPQQRLRHITQIVQSQQFTKDPIMRGLQFTISDQPMQVSGHVLPPPTLLMKEEFKPAKGVWDIRNKAFYVGASLKCWAVCNYDAGFVRQDALKKFVANLRKIGCEQGMAIEEPTFVQNYRNPKPENDIPAIKKKYPNIQIIMVVLPRDADYYAQVKKVGDREVGVITQCVTGLNVQKNGAPVIGNILLKINAKIGGTNNVLGHPEHLLVFNTPVMIMGADVNHPPAYDQTTPSLAAVVASFDRHASKYAVEVRHQKQRTEMIQDLKEMTKNLLKAFFRASKKKPQRIIMYRDGVSESQFLEVLSFELKAMRAACTELEADYKPPMTFIVVQKRHHIRLFCSDRDGVGKSGNIPPGTTVDTSITHPTQRDFYLCSHQGIVGTSRPTHYHLLWDDSDLPMELLQNLTYAMCHLYSRCSRSVSIPAPAYYAHLVAFRAKIHIRDFFTSEDSSQDSDADIPTDAQMKDAARVDISDVLSNQLYYV